MGIGIDIVQIPRFERMLQSYNYSKLTKIFLPIELKSAESYSTIKGKACCLAKRFAAKEAFVKAMGTGFKAGSLWLHDVYVVNGSDKAPKLELSSRAQKLCIERLGCHPKILLSLSDDYPVAIAQVMLV